MSGWVSPHRSCIKSDPTWGAEAWRWAGRMGARLPTEWMVLCGGVDLRAFTEGLGANFWAHAVILANL